MGIERPQRFAILIKLTIHAVIETHLRLNATQTYNKWQQHKNMLSRAQTKNQKPKAKNQEPKTKKTTTKTKQEKKKKENRT